MGCTDMKPAGLRSEPVSPLHNLFTERHQPSNVLLFVQWTDFGSQFFDKKKKKKKNLDPSKERLFDYLSGSAIIICTNSYYYALLL